MTNFGYKLSSEEHSAPDLVRNARRAEEVGFDFGAISDHFHPWIDKQGESPFVWGVIGAIGQATTNLRILTGVTCPSIRVHPAIVAQASATAASLMPGRFMLGLGSGENLNEHVLGDRWPAAGERIEMLTEAIEVIRSLWKGGNTNHRGKHYTVENARIYSLPEELPPVIVAGSGKKAIALAGKNDGLISLAPDEDLLATFDHAGGAGKPKFAEVNICWGPDETEAVTTALEWWPVGGIGGELMQELPLPRHFEQAASTVRPDDLTKTISCGPDPDKHAANIKKFIEAGYDHIWIHQIGPDQSGFLDFAAKDLLPRL
ncbi:MAG: TIGR03557 family F420-dependent LLM class oxidoreductase [Actinomycetota bacterium]